MAVKKIAISVPNEVLIQVDRLAKKAKSTRSGYITQVLRQISHASTQAEVTHQINELFSDVALVEEQSETAHIFWKAAEPSTPDWEW